MSSKEVKDSQAGKPSGKLEELDIDSIEKICTYIKPLESRPKAEIHREWEFNLRPLAIPHCEIGTGDLIIINPDGSAELCDYKMGFWEVDDAESNVQIQVYVLGIFITWPQVHTVNVHILQPWRDEVSTATYTRNQLEALLLRPKLIVDRVEKLAGKEFNVYPSNCIWCTAKATCKAVIAAALQVSRQAKLEIPKSFTVDDALDQAQAGIMFSWVEIFEKFVKDTKWTITQMARDCKLDVDGYDLKESSPKREIISTVGAYNALKGTEFEMDFEQFLAACSVSVTEFGKVVAASTPRGLKEVQKKKAFELLVDEGLVCQNSPSLYLTRIHNKA